MEEPLDKQLAICAQCVLVPIFNETISLAYLSVLGPRPGESVVDITRPCAPRSWAHDLSPVDLGLPWGHVVLDYPPSHRRAEVILANEMDRDGYTRGSEQL